MKKIDNGIYTVAHNIVFVDKDYDFLSLFLKGNRNLLDGKSNINKIHVCVGFTTGTFKLFEMINDLAKTSKSKIILHTCTNTINRNFKVFLQNNNYSVNMNYNMHEDKKPFSFNDDVGELTVFPYNVTHDKTGTVKTIKRKMVMLNRKKRKEKKTNGVNEKH